MGSLWLVEVKLKKLQRNVVNNLMNSFLNTKKNSEYVWASTFVNYVNKTQGTNYRVIPEQEENSPVDMHLICESCAHQHLDLQLTHAIEVPFIALQDHMDVDYSKHPTIEAIEHKTIRLTEQKADLSKIILIIQGYMNPEMASKVFADKVFAKYKQSRFAGIYYVAPPMISGETDEFVQDGLVVSIKDYFTK